MALDLLSSPVTFTTGCCFCFGSISSFFLELFLQSSNRVCGTYWQGKFIFKCPIFSPLQTVHVVLKARILKWFAISFSNGPRLSELSTTEFELPHRKLSTTWGGRMKYIFLFGLMATHSSTLAWNIPWMVEPIVLSPWGRKELDTTEQLHFTIFFENLWGSDVSKNMLLSNYWKILGRWINSRP